MNAATLRAQSFPLTAAPDLLDHYGVADGFFFEHGGTGVVSIGVAATIEILPGPDHIARAAAEAEGLFAAIGGDRPVIVGALPFDGTSAGRLIVPQAAIVTDARAARLIVTGRAGLPEPENPLRRVRAEPVALAAVEPVPTPDRYVAAVAEAVEQIRAGALRKVVLARTLEVTADHALDVPVLMERLRAAEPHAYLFATPRLVGATPELLVGRAGSSVVAIPLAGTAARTGSTDDEVANALMASDKDRDEHAVVVEAVRDALAPVCSSLQVPTTPSVIATGKVLHLSTEVTGTLAAPAPSALALAARLHPTPAVCGAPRDGALEAIRRLEGFDRGLYAGIVGWMDGSGDGAWAVSLRCAAIDGATARLYAGAGIVAASDPEAELAETDAKFRSMIDALGYA